MAEIMRITIPLPPVTKKNHSQIVTNRRTGKPMTIPSAHYTAYADAAGWYIRIPDKPIETRVNVQALYYMPTLRIVDLPNLHAALHDVLVAYNVVADDNSRIIAGTDGSRVLLDREHPRTEVIITDMED